MGLTTTTNNFTDLITFTRASTATYTDSNGVVQTAQANVPRFDYDPVTKALKGLLIEEARTNLFKNSNQIHLWSGLTSQAFAQGNAAVAPDGTISAAKLSTLSASSADPYIGQVATAGIGTYTFSVWLWTDAGQSTEATLYIYNGNLSEVGVKTITLTTTPKRYDLTKVITVATSTISARVDLRNAAGTSQYIYAWGGQLEVGAFVTSYIQTPATFTSRASIATYFDQNGVMQTAATNVARNGYGYVAGQGWVSQGLILEPAATNKAFPSQGFSNVAWTKSGATASDTALAPDGTNTASTLTENVGVSSRHGILKAGFTFQQGSNTVSVFVKANGRNKLKFVAYGTGMATSSAITGDISTYVPVGSGWYRVNVVLSCDVVPVSGYIEMWMYDGTSEYYYGDGVSGVTAWGLQVEAGTVATSYIPTTSAAVTRAADVSSSSTATRNSDAATATVGSWYNQSEGTLFVEFDSMIDDAGVRIGSALVLKNADGSNQHRIFKYRNKFGSTTRFGNVTVSDIQPNSLVAQGVVGRHAYAYKENDTMACTNGVLGTVDTSVTIPTDLTTFCVGGEVNNGYLSGHIRSIKYFPRRLSNAELQTLTA